MTVTDDVLDSMDYEDDATDVVEDTEDAPYLPVKGMSVYVPKSFGKLVSKLYADTMDIYQGEYSKWDMIFKLYRQCGNENLDKDLVYDDHFENSADENIIRSNMRTIMRSTYMQNPHIEFTDVTVNPDGPDDGGLGESLEFILDFLLNKRSYPGLNMKPKARRWILHGQLTNFGILRLDYQAKEGSRQEAVEELRKLEKELADAKNVQEVKEIYAKLEQLHKALPLSQNKGMSISNVLPQNLIIDPNCTMPDLSDADWIIERFDMDRIYMQQTYYDKDEDGVLHMRSNPKATTEAVDEATTADVKQNVLNTVLNHTTSERQELIQKDTVQCIWFYDKILRRVSLFNTEDWCYPLWVSDDDMQLSRFFRHFIVQFGDSIDGVIQPGEASFYVGQVQEINRINRQAKNVRDIAFNTLVYNKKAVDSKDVAKLVNHLNNPRRVRAFGIGQEPDKKVNELLEALLPPSFAYKELFDTQSLRASVDRAANTSEVDKGGQFKTNTTNQAVGAYAQMKQENTGVLVDTIEDAFSDLGWAMSEILVSKYSTEDIVALVGAKKAEGFTTMSVEEFNQTFRMVVASGSIEKPTTQWKKDEALKVAGALGQVGQSAPGTTLKIMLRMFKEAFSGLLVKKEDWKLLDQETQANLSKGVSTNGPTQPPAV